MGPNMGRSYHGPIAMQYGSFPILLYILILNQCFFPDSCCDIACICNAPSTHNEDIHESQVIVLHHVLSASFSKTKKQRDKETRV